MAEEYLMKLVKAGLISRDQLAEAEAMARKEGVPAAEMLVKMGYVAENEVRRMQAAEYGFEFVDVSQMEISPGVIGMIPQSVALENCVLPLELEGERLKLAVADALNYEVLDKVRFIINKEIDVVVASREAIQTCLNKYYGQDHGNAAAGGGGGGGGESVDSMMMEFTETAIDFTETEAAKGSGATAWVEDASSPILRLANLIIAEAVRMRASDIHIEPFDEKIRIRYRIDGVLVERDNPPKRLQSALIARMKIMGNMDITEKRRPQDGRIKTNVDGKDLDLRVNILPTKFGQAIVMRILDRDNIKVGIRNLGFSEDNFRRFQNIIRRPNGIFLVTGPTGSGKTTTLYSALGEMNRPDKKIITAEDPVEYYLPGINQTEVKADIGLNFQKIIKAMLRQAPNIILVGEIRDSETAEIAIQASLTGHLVFSTLHTNDAPSSVTRLIDMGVEPFLVASSLMAVMAQRLVRVCCPKCKAPHDPDPSEIQYFGITPEQAMNATFMRGKGCNNCSQSGYRGRNAVFELMTMNSALREMTFKNEPSQNIRRQARLFGMKTLVEDAVDKALIGKTTLTEAWKLDKGGH